MIFFILSLVIFLMVTPASDAISVSHGEAAPAFSLPSVDGKTASLSDYSGKVVVIIFWRTDQERSLLALKDANSLLSKYKDKDVKVFGIIEDSDNVDEARKIFRDNSISYPLLIDGDRQIYGKYGVRVFPTTVIVDREGVIVYDIPSHPLTYKTKLRGYIRRALGIIDEKELSEDISPHTGEQNETALEAHRQYNLALKFTESGMHDMAVDAAKKSIAAGPDMPNSYILLGFLYLEMKDAEESLKTFHKALELAPQSNDARTGLGGALILKGDLDEAIKILDSATVANPYPQMAYYELGRAYEQKGDKEKSSQMYKKAIEKIIKKQVLPSSIGKCK